VSIRRRETCGPLSACTSPITIFAVSINRCASHRECRPGPQTAFGILVSCFLSLECQTAARCPSSLPASTRCFMADLFASLRVLESPVYSGKFLSLMAKPSIPIDPLRRMSLDGIHQRPHVERGSLPCWEFNPFFRSTHFQVVGQFELSKDSPKCLRRLFNSSNFRCSAICSATENAAMDRGKSRRIESYAVRAFF
jgi:hypothetical protein